MPVASLVTTPHNLKIANFVKADVSATTYFLAIDLDNASGAYKHTGTTGIEIATMNGLLVKTVMTGEWASFIGVVLDVNVSYATISWLRPLGSIGLKDTSAAQQSFAVNYLPFVLNTTVVGGETIHIASNFQENIAELSTGNTIEDISGGSYAVAPGDLILKIDKLASSGTILFHYSFGYKTE